MAESSTAAESSTPLRKWPFNSPYYNPLTMNSTTLQELKENLLYEENQLAYIQLRGDQITGDLQLELKDPQARNAFASSMKARDPDVVIFFMQHIYQHRHTAEGHKGDIRFTLSLDEETWTWMLEEMKIHPKFVESLYYFLGNYSTYVTYDEDGKTADAFHVLVKVFPAGHLEAAFYLRYDFRTSKAMVLVAGNDLAGHVQYLITHLAELKQKWHPFGIIYTIISRYFYYLEWQRRQLDHSVIMMERVTGRGAIVYSGGQPEEPDPAQFNLKNMHWIGGNQRNMIYAMDFQVRLTTFLHDAHRQFVSIRLGYPSLLKTDKMTLEDRHLQEAFQAHAVSAKGVFEDSRVIGERAQWQLNAADSITNTVIAKQSQRTADESKSIAFEARRDSTSMKTIAGLTMVYLPSTFAATIFSTRFFSFADSSGSLNVHGDIWKFIMVSVVLTVLTVLVWVYLNKHGIPKFTQLGSAQSKVQDSSTGEQKAGPPVILLDLPQEPGHRAQERIRNANQRSSASVASTRAEGERASHQAIEDPRDSTAGGQSPGQRSGAVTHEADAPNEAVTNASPVPTEGRTRIEEIV